MKYILILNCLLLAGLTMSSQTTAGIGFYPTGTEAGVGFRLNKDKKMSFDARITRANFYSDLKNGQSNFVTELSGLYRIIILEKVKFHIGLGFRGDWNLITSHKYGIVAPVGVEAFPFPFQNAGLIFEVAPYCVMDIKSNFFGGIRTVAGFVFYFPVNKKDKNKEQ